MSKELAVFPITKNMCALARRKALLDEYNLRYLLAPSYLRLSNKDICCIDGGHPAGELIVDYCHDKLKDCQSLFVDYDENIKNMTTYSEVIDKATSLGLDVFTSRELSKRFNKDQFIQTNDVLNTENSESDRLYEIRIPVVTVLSQGVRTDQFAVELSLREHFIKSGYNVTQLGSSEASSLFGFHNYPSFLYKRITSYEKILMLNRFLKRITEKEQSDVLILGVPDSTMKMNDRVLNGLGLIPFAVCNAVKSDLAIYCLYFEEFKETYFREISNHCFYRFGVPVKHFNIANSSVIPDASSEIPKVNFVDLKSTFVFDSLLRDISYDEYKLYNILNTRSSTLLCSDVIDELANNIHTLG